MNNQESIGIFDSGLGGLTVMRELLKSLPQENMVYFADTAHLPYGEKSTETLIQRAICITDFLYEKGAKLIVIACHTASTCVVDVLQKQFSIPILGIIQPTIDAVIRTSKKRIGLLATERTISSGIYQQLIHKHIPESEVFPLACSPFVPLIEQGKITDPLTPLIIHETLKELRKKDLEVALLGSTHYPLIKDLIGRALGAQVKLIDPAKVVAEYVHEFLIQNNLANTENSSPTLQFFASKDQEKFRDYADSFLKIAVNS